MRKILVFLCFFGFLCASTGNVRELSWGGGETLLSFFEKNNIPSDLYYKLDREDKELASEITAEVKYWTLRDDSNNILQALIPISDDLQIHISRLPNSRYELKFEPIEYEIEDKILSIELEGAPYNDIKKASGSTSLAQAIILAFKGTVDFKRIQKGDRLVIIYTQKRRMGKLFGVSQIKAAMIKKKNATIHAYRFKDAYYDANGREMERYFLIQPMKNARISSHFSKARFHPILRRYRAHLGTDYAAPKGTNVHAAGDGTVIFAGVKGGYGNTLIVKHSGDFTTLYAHLSGFAKGMKQGTKVKQGQHIAYVGNTGMSTGPHLHFGVYRGKEAIDSQRVLSVVKSDTAIREKKEFENLKQSFELLFAQALSSDYENPPKEEFFDNIIPLS